MENFLVIGGLGLMIIGGFIVVYYGFFWILALSGQAGMKMIKGTQLENKDTDINMIKNKAFMGSLQSKIIRGIIGFAIGGGMYLIAGLLYKS
ncbi:MAG: hypothetical protein MUC49_17445 [Raineya sp.]|jgi:hypothetical protein|nr:hypothetical protein [Raineya sp.]